MRVYDARIIRELRDDDGGHNLTGRGWIPDVCLRTFRPVVAMTGAVDAATIDCFSVRGRELVMDDASNGGGRYVVWRHKNKRYLICLH